MPEEDKEQAKACAHCTRPFSDISSQHTKEREQERSDLPKDLKDRGRVGEMGCGPSKPAEKSSGQKQQEKEEIDDKEPLDLIKKARPFHPHWTGPMLNRVKWLDEEPIKNDKPRKRTAVEIAKSMRNEYPHMMSTVQHENWNAVEDELWYLKRGPNLKLWKRIKMDLLAHYYCHPHTFPTIADLLQQEYHKKFGQEEIYMMIQQLKMSGKIVEDPNTGLFCMGH